MGRIVELVVALDVERQLKVLREPEDSNLLYRFRQSFTMRA